MSWSARTDAVAKDAIALDEPPLSDVVEVEQRAQFEAAVEAAKALAAVVGRPSDAVIVTLNGHANPDHGPRAGWANETITVSVSAIPASD
jgi:hypothetical protein